MPDEDAITSIETALVRVPLARPLQLGRMTIAEREYALVRVSTDDGLHGGAYGLTRGIPVTAAAAEQATAAIGMPADDIAAVAGAVARGEVSGQHPGASRRAASLLDIALWDIRGKRQGLPIWRLLGGRAPETPCVRVGGYPTGEPPETLGERVAQLAREGHELIKVARISPAGDLAELLGAAARDVPARTRFVVDAAWCWATAEEAQAEIDLWGSAAPLAWVEDPFAPEEVEQYRRLRASARVPIGVGDELTDPEVAHRLMAEARIDVLRIDATTIGGITQAWELSRSARELDVPVSFHIYPETHVHLAAAGGAGELTETFGVAGQIWDPAARLYAGGPTFRPGRAVAPDAPGLGIEFDLEFIAAHRVGGETIAA